MRKYKIAALVLAAAVCASVFSGCKPTDDPPVSAAVVSPPTSAAVQHIKQTFPNGLTIDADVSVPKGLDAKALKIQKVEAVPFSPKKATQLLLGGDKIKSHQSQNQGATRGGNTSPVESYITADGSDLSVDQAMGILSFSTPLSESISYAYFDGIERSSTSGKSNRDKFNKKELSFMTSRQAAQKAEEILSQLGIPALMRPEVVALDQATLQSQEEDPKKVDIKPETAPRKKGTWTENDECYVLYFNQNINGISTKGIEALDDPLTPKIVMYLGKNGVVELEAYAYRPTGEAAEIKPSVPVEKAVQAFTDQFGAAKLPSAATVKAIRLQYALRTTKADSDVSRFTPIWEFSGPAQKQDINTVFARVDAITGKVIRN